MRLAIRLFGKGRTMNEFMRIVENNGDKVPQGLYHILMHHGTSRQEVYRYMYGQLVHGGKLATPGSTLIYPLEIRNVVRKRFADASSGQYDAHYDKKDDCIRLTIKQLIDFPWRPPPKKCDQCKTTKSQKERYKPY
ncbi:uncharacterized protein [Haliotis asinina]|uniref:uncharacterized protein n=1 Tax=Haliotis asinina TaxID=109174 RepID=UPI003531FCC9